MTKTPKDDESSEEVMTAAALDAARKAFEKHLSDNMFDPGYWDIRFTAWIKDANLEHRLSRIEIEREVKG